MAYNRKQMRKIALSFLDLKIPKVKLNKEQLNELADCLIEKETHVNNGGYMLNNDDCNEVVNEYLEDIYDVEL